MAKEDRLEFLLNKRDITDEERKERDKLIVEQLNSASNRIKGSV